MNVTSAIYLHVCRLIFDTHLVGRDIAAILKNHQYSLGNLDESHELVAVEPHLPF